MKLIGSSILVALLLLVGWNLTLRALPGKYRFGGNAGSQWEQNKMKAEQFIDSGRTPNGAIVGSSISARLHDLPAGWFNLGLQGESAFTGLAIIRASQKKVPIILIETNVLALEANRDLMDGLTNVITAKLRPRIPSMLETNKPHNVVLRVVKPNSPAPATRPATTPTVDTLDDPNDPPADLLQARIDRRKEQLHQPYKPGQLDAIERELAAHVKHFESLGCKVFLFECPEYAGSRDLPRPSLLRERLHKQFAQEKWVPDLNWSEFKTTDAVHLNGPSAKKYAQFLSEFIRSQQ